MRKIWLFMITLALLLPASAQKKQYIGAPTEPPCPPPTRTPAKVTEAMKQYRSSRKAPPTATTTSASATAQVAAGPPPCDQACHDHEAVMQMLQNDQKREADRDARDAEREKAMNQFLQTMADAEKLKAQALDKNADANLKFATVAYVLKDVAGDYIKSGATVNYSQAKLFDRTHKYPKLEAAGTFVANVGQLASYPLGRIFGKTDSVNVSANASPSTSNVLSNPFTQVLKDIGNSSPSTAISIVNPPGGN